MGVVKIYQRRADSDLKGDILLVPMHKFQYDWGGGGGVFEIRE